MAGRDEFDVCICGHLDFMHRHHRKGECMALVNGATCNCASFHGDGYHAR
jgi:hypothetical protein